MNFKRFFAVLLAAAMVMSAAGQTAFAATTLKIIDKITIKAPAGTYPADMQITLTKVADKARHIGYGYVYIFLSADSTITFSKDAAISTGDPSKTVGVFKAGKTYTYAEYKTSLDGWVNGAAHSMGSFAMFMDIGSFDYYGNTIIETADLATGTITPSASAESPTPTPSATTPVEKNTLIDKATVKVPYFPDLEITMTNVPKLVGETDFSNGLIHQVKFYYDKDTTLSFNKDMIFYPSQLDEPAYLNTGGVVKASDYPSGIFSTYIIVSANGTWTFSDGNFNITAGQKIYILCFIDVQFYEKNVAEGLKFTDIRDWKKETVAPPEPGSVMTVRDVEVGVKLTWTKAKDAAAYYILRYSEGTAELIYQGGPDASEFVDANVKSNTEYGYFIGKVVKGKNGELSEVVVSFEKGALLEDEHDKAVETEVELLSGIGITITTGTIRGENIPGRRGYLLMRIGDPYMSVNGEETEIDPGRGTTPVIKDGRTLMPIRAAIEAMNGAVAWIEAERRVSLSVNINTVDMILGSRNFSVNGAQEELDVPPQIINDRTMLPIRFVAENIGCEIAWVGSSKEVIVVYGIQ